MSQVVVIGAGLAGLSCAARLQRHGLTPLVLEATDGIGGRVRTDVVDGFRLDRGFQVLLDAYPEARSALDMEALELRAFSPGALVRHAGRFHRVSDPFREPARSLKTLFGPIGSFGDKLRVARLRHRCRSGSIDDQLTGPDVSTLDYLRSAGIGPPLIERFFRPFLGGIFLDPSLSTSSRMFRFVFRMFAEGSAVVPRLGMASIPAQLASHLPDGTIRLGARVVDVSPGRIVLESGEVVTCAEIVIATDGSQAARWLPAVREPLWCRVRCLYFAAERAPVEEPILILDGEGTGPINNLCFPTRVSPGYGPGRGELVSVTVLDRDAADAAAGDADLLGAVRRQLVEWFGPDASAWHHLRTYDILHALPRQEPGWIEPRDRPVRAHERVYVAGDHLETASTNGALRAGRRAAEAVLEDRGRD